MAKPLQKPFFLVIFGKKLQKQRESLHKGHGPKNKIAFEQNFAPKKKDGFNFMTYRFNNYLFSHLPIWNLQQIR
jgi:hypothetical protein